MQLLDKMLGKLLKRGELTIIGPSGQTHRYGSPDPELKPVTVRLMDNRAALQVVKDPALGFVETWMDDRLRFEAHLGECDACRDYVEQFEQTIALSGRVEAEELPPGLQDELLAAFRAWRGEQPL